MLSPILFIRRNSITKLHLNFIYILSLSCFPIYDDIGRMHSRSSKVIVCYWVLSCDSGPEPESAKFDRLQLRLQPKRSTLTDSNSGLDSDSAALLQGL